MSGQQTLIVHAPSKLGSIRTLSDGTIKTEVYISKELPDDEMTMLFKLAKAGEGWFLFSPNPIDMDAIPKERANSGYDGKSPSQRLHARLYVRWAQLTDQSEPFDIYYAKFIESVIARVSEDLPERA